MRRAANNILVVDPLTGSAIGGAVVEIRERGSGNLATLYQTEGGVSTIANPTVSDTWGRVPGWLDRGEYRADISGTGIASYSIYFEAAPAADGAIDTDWIADDAVTPQKLALDPISGGFSPALVFTTGGSAQVQLGFDSNLFKVPAGLYMCAVSLDYQWNGAAGNGVKFYWTQNGAIVPGSNVMGVESNQTIYGDDQNYARTEFFNVAADDTVLGVMVESYSSAPNITIKGSSRLAVCRLG